MQEIKSIIGKRCARLDEIEKLAQFIAEQFNPKKIILFGTYAYGNPTPESDVDLLIIISSEKNTWDLNVEISAALDHAFPLDIVVKTVQGINDRLLQGDFFIQEILDKGKLLYERTD
jgi:predicted nucleotidyltransferase